MTHDPYNAFVDMDPAAHAGEGALAGVTVGVKSNIMVKGLPWTGGMGLHRSRLADRDAEVVTQLRGAGAVILGTVNMHEAALGAVTDNAFYGRTHNPHHHDYTPGGSSGGSGAAVAAGLCDVALGTDTLGSVRIPAAYCGVYGLKPTNGAVSNDGLAFLQPDLDCIGPLAASLDMLERVWEVMGNGGREVELKRLLLLEDLAGIECEIPIIEGYHRALSATGLGASLLTLPDRPTEIRMAGLVAAGQWLIADLGDAYHADSDQLSDELKFILSVCEREASRPKVLERTRDKLRAELGDDGFLLLPTTPHAAFAHGTRAPASQADFTSMANIAGLPALALPSGWSGDGLPVGVQLIGPAGSETALFDLARTLDAALDAYRPPASL